jgi:hypothetical protein
MSAGGDAAAAALAPRMYATERWYSLSISLRIPPEAGTNSSSNGLPAPCPSSSGNLISSSPQPEQPGAAAATSANAIQVNRSRPYSEDVVRFVARTPAHIHGEAAPARSQKRSFPGAN